jgi:hypothetical protein
MVMTRTMKEDDEDHVKKQLTMRVAKAKRAAEAQIPTW